jgi:hypothetical protein
VDYWRQFNITPDMAYGTAVNICTMVFGNMGGFRHGRGLYRDPGTGDNALYGDYLVNAQEKTSWPAFALPALTRAAHRYAGNLQTA